MRTPSLAQSILVDWPAGMSVAPFLSLIESPHRLSIEAVVSSTTMTSSARATPPRIPTVERALTVNWERNRRPNVVGTVAVCVTCTALQPLGAWTALQGLPVVGSFWQGIFSVASVARHLNVTVGTPAFMLDGWLFLPMAL